MVTPGQRIKIEKLPKEAGEEVVFEEVLLKDVDGNLSLGDPILKDVKVTGKVVSQGKGEKLIVFQFKNKKRYKKKKGHRQLFTEIEILSV